MRVMSYFIVTMVINPETAVLVTGPSSKRQSLRTRGPGVGVDQYNDRFVRLTDDSDTEPLISVVEKTYLKDLKAELQAVAELFDSCELESQAPEARITEP